MHKNNPRVSADLEVTVKHRVPLVITSLGANTEVVDAVHGYGGLVFHDVINMRHARKAAEAGVDGLIAVCAGAGGHAGTTSPFALVSEIRAFFAKTIILSGAISTGRQIAAAIMMGADLAYLGTRFIATRESLAKDGFKEMIVSARAADIVYTPAISGVHGNFLASSLIAAGLDPDNLPIKTEATRPARSAPGRTCGRRAMASALSTTCRRSRSCAHGWCESMTKPARRSRARPPPLRAPPARPDTFLCRSSRRSSSAWARWGAPASINWRSAATPCLASTSSRRRIVRLEPRRHPHHPRRDRRERAVHAAGAALARDWRAMRPRPGEPADRQRLPRDFKRRTEGLTHVENFFATRSRRRERFNIPHERLSGTSSRASPPIRRATTRRRSSSQVAGFLHVRNASRESGARAQARRDDPH